MQLTMPIAITLPFLAKTTAVIHISPREEDLDYTLLSGAWHPPSTATQIRTIQAARIAISFQFTNSFQDSYSTSASPIEERLRTVPGVGSEKAGLDASGVCPGR